jgi:hypothetical protein
MVLERENLRADSILKAVAATYRHNNDQNIAAKRSNIYAPLDVPANAVTENYHSSETWNESEIRQIALKLSLLNEENDTLLGCLQNLFESISTQKKPVGVVGPKNFVTKLKEANGKELLNEKSSAEQCSKMHMKCSII